MKPHKTEYTVDIKTRLRGSRCESGNDDQVFLNLDTQHDFNHFTRKPDKYRVTSGIGPVCGH